MQCHSPVQNAGVRKFVTMHHKSVTFVKSDGMGLGIEVQRGVTALSCVIDKQHQNCTAHAMVAPIPQYRHTADMSVRKQATGADRTPPRIMCQCVQRHGIEFIPLERFRDLLLQDEHGPAQILQ